MKYSELCETYEELEKNPSRLKKIEILTKFLKKIKKSKNKEIIYLLQGRVFPDYNKTELGVSSQLIKKAVAKSTGASENEITKIWKKIGDLGSTAEELVKSKKQRTLSSHILTAEKVLENLKKLPEFKGAGTVNKKIGLVSELLTSAKPIEARYVVRTVLSDLRIGTGESTIRDAIVETCLEKGKENSELIEDVYDKSLDFAAVFEKACKGKRALAGTVLSPGKAVKVMLYPKVDNVKEGFERAGKPTAFEYKYDGFRIMINKDEKGEISLFTRRLDNVSNQFPDLVKAVKENIRGKSFIIDSEAVGYDPKTKLYQPFQFISQRIKRKHHIERLEKELPVELVVFDVIYHNGKSYIKEPFAKRRKLIDKIIKEQKRKIVLAEQKITSSEKEAEEFFNKAIKEGQEGLMVKKLDAPYKPGSRVGYGFKLKPEARDFDLVITGAEYGTGKRAGWLTSFDVSCRGKKRGKFLEVGKVSTGFKEKVEMGMSFKEMSKKIKKLIIKSHGKHVDIKPKLVVTVIYQNIQKSPKYTSGFALRFPRFSRLRPDRGVGDIATLGEIRREYGK